MNTSARKQIFANNVVRMLKYHNLTRIEAAKRWQINYDLLNRWSSAGVAYAHPKTLVQFERLSKIFGFDDISLLWQVWNAPHRIRADEILIELRSRITLLEYSDKYVLHDGLMQLIEEIQNEYPSFKFSWEYSRPKLKASLGSKLAEENRHFVPPMDTKNDDSTSSTQFGSALDELTEKQQEAEKRFYQEFE